MARGLERIGSSGQRFPLILQVNTQLQVWCTCTFLRPCKGLHSSNRCSLASYNALSLFLPLMNAPTHRHRYCLQSHSWDHHIPQDQIKRIINERRRNLPPTRAANEQPRNEERADRTRAATGGPSCDGSVAAATVGDAHGCRSPASILAILESVRRYQEEEKTLKRAYTM